MAAVTNWKKQWGYEVAPTGGKGVLRLRRGGWLVWGKVSDQGKKRIATRVLHEGTLREAEAARLVMLSEARQLPPNSRPPFSRYAPSLFARKVDLRELKSAKTVERWDTTLRLHLIPTFGPIPMNQLSKLEIEEWKRRVAQRIASGKVSPTTANGWLSILRVIVRSAVDDFELERDPTLRVKDFATAEHATYTQEDPNSLSTAQCAEFLAATLKLFPQHYAMAVLGFATGLRPSTLRPLRRRGTGVDVLWNESALLVRRSNSLGQHVMNTTKTGIAYKLGLPEAVMDVLRWHVERLTGRRSQTDLLFPSKRGGFMSRSALDKPFAAVSTVIGLRFTLSPRGMRRTFQDLARDAGVEKNVRKAVCGHATDEMSDHYSTVRLEEMRAAVSKVFSAVAGPEKGLRSGVGRQAAE